MPKVTIIEDRCKGCRLCEAACPKKIIGLDAGKLNPKGYHPASVSDADKCVACASCAVMCPETIITVEK